MAEEKPKKPSVLAKRREQERLKRQRTGDTLEKREEPTGDSYDAKDAKTRVGLSGLVGGGSGGG